MDGNIKQILGLLWALIRYYHIGSTGRGLSTRSAMLLWVNEEVPGLNINNFTTDWNSGIALCKLVNHIKPGLASDLSTTQGLFNCTLGMQMASEELGIPQVIKPEHLNHSDVDELSVMTYVSYFCKPAADKLLAWVNSIMPQQGITNFCSDWNNGINFAALIEALYPGLFSNYNELDPNEPVCNLERVIKIAEESMGIQPVVSAEIISDPYTDRLNIITYILRFKNAKPVSLPHLVKSVGPGLVKGFVGQRTYFSIDTTRGGLGKIAIEIVTRSGVQLPYELIPMQNGIYKCIFVPVKSGKAKIHVLWNSQSIPGSPFAVTFIDTGPISISSPQITGGRYGKLGETMEILVTEVSDNSLLATVEHINGQREMLTTGLSSTGDICISYEPTVVGIDLVHIEVAHKEIPGSPFQVGVIDLNRCHIAFANHAMGKPFLLGNSVKIVIEAINAGLQTVFVDAKASSGLVPIPCSKGDENGIFYAKYTPVEVGTHFILAACDEDTLLGNPLSLTVVNPREVILVNAIPQFLQKNQIFYIQICINNAGPGKLEAVSFNSDVLAVTLQDQKDNNSLYLKLESFNYGSAEINVTWSGYSLLNMPCTIKVCNATNVVAYGTQIDAGFGIVGTVFKFQVKATDAGIGDLNVFIRSPSKIYFADISYSDETYVVSFIPYETGSYVIDVTWGGELISNAPFSVTIALSYARKFTATGDSLNSCIATKTSKFSLDGPESGLVSSEKLNVSISMSDGNSADFSLVDNEVRITILDNQNGSYTIEYTVPVAGEYIVGITISGEHIPGSPYILIALPSPNALLCHAIGKAITQPTCLAVGSLLEFAVDCTAGGTGSLAVAAYDPTMMPVSVFVEDDFDNQRVHHIKIEPKFQGNYIVEVKWCNEHIINSPFTFEVGDPSQVVITSIPDSESFVAKVGQSFLVVVDKSKAGRGKMEVCLNFADNYNEHVQLHSEENGICSYLCIPESMGMVELDVRFCGICVLPKPWIVEVVDPLHFKVLPPGGFCKQGHHIKFVVMGLGKKDIKNLMIKALHENHDATVKLEMKKDGTAMARFTAKLVGSYTISVTCAQENICGSPFTVNVVNPDMCVLKDDIPSCLALGCPVVIDVDTSKCGPGELEYLLTDDELTDKVYLKCTITVVSLNLCKLSLYPCSVGLCKLTVQWAGFNVVENVSVSIVDINRCTYRCPQIDVKGFIKQNDAVNFFINTALCGQCFPLVTAHGPQATYETDLLDLGSGSYQARFVAWQPGVNSIHISIADQPVPMEPIEFVVVRAIKASDITVTGSLKALSNHASTLTIHALESDLLTRGLLSYNLKAVPSMEQYNPAVHCTDNKDGTYILSYTPYEPCLHILEILYEGDNIAGGPFNVVVEPEPRADKCFAFGKALDPGVTVTSNMEATFVIDSTAAGSGTLSVSGKQPDGQATRVFVNTEVAEAKTLHFLMFNTGIVGIYSISVLWDDVPIPGNPFEITVVDPIHCKLITDTPLCIQVGASEIVIVDCTNAGPGNFVVKLSDSNSLQAVTARLLSEDKHKVMYKVSLFGKCVSESLVSITFGGKLIENCPFVVNVIDTTLCHLDCNNIMHQYFVVGKPFQFTVVSEGAGKSVLSVQPVQHSEATYTLDIESVNNLHTVLCTPWKTGTQGLEVLYGDLPVPGSPFNFSVCDPSKCEVIGLPNPNSYVALMGKCITFSVDSNNAGVGKLAIFVQQGNLFESLSYLEHDAIAEVSYTPHTPGNLEVIISYNGVNLLSVPHIYEVLEPQRFQVTPFKGIGKCFESVCFTFSGVDDGVETFSAVAKHDKGNAPVILEQTEDVNVFLGKFIPEFVGQYEILVQQANINITGSPFLIEVINPEAITILSETPAVWSVAEKFVLLVEAAEAGPGELGCEVSSCTTNKEVVPHLQLIDEVVYQIEIMIDLVGLYDVYIKWADYVVQPSPLRVSFIDPSKVTVRLLHSNMLFVGKCFHVKVDCHECGEGGIPELNVYSSNDEAVSASLECLDNQNGSYTYSVTVWSSGLCTAHVTWGEQVICNAISFDVHQLIDPKRITATGKGLQTAVTTVPSVIIVNALEVNLLKNGLLSANCYDPNVDMNVLVKVDELENVIRDSPKLTMVDKLDGTYSITILYSYEGIYILDILYDSQPINGSPFHITVKAAPNAENCFVFGPSITKMKGKLGLLVNEPIEFSVDATDAGEGEISCKAKDPLGNAVQVFSSESLSEHSCIYHFKIDPHEVGVYSVCLYWSSVEIQGTPLEFSIVDPMKCIAEGLPGIVQLNEELVFFLKLEKIGMLPPVVTLDKLGRLCTLIEPIFEENGQHMYQVPSNSVGNFTINVTIANIHIPGSPFIYDVIDPDEFTVCGLNVLNKSTLVCEIVSFQIHGEPPDHESFSVIAHGPLADIPCNVIGSLDGTHYQTSFVPVEPGSYEVFVECANKHILGSPFTVNVVDPSKCVILSSLSQLQVGMAETVVVKTRGAGIGNLKATLQKETECPELDIYVESQGLDTYSITLNPLAVSNHDITILWADFPIPSSPIKVNVCDASMCKIYGHSITSQKGKVGEPISFTILSRSAGNAKLSVKACGPSAQYAVLQKETGDSKHDVMFTPWEVGINCIQVYYGSHEIPGSPFTITVERQTGDAANSCHATGEGLKKALAGKEAQFTILCSDPNLLVAEQLKVSVIGVQTCVETTIINCGSGYYQVKYIPPLPGAYIIRITHIEKEIPGSPFKINCVPGPDASKCIVQGLSNTSLHVSGNPISFVVNATNAGNGQLRVYVQGPNDYHPQVYVSDNGKGCYSVKFDAMKHGKYFIVVAWSETQIQGSPFKLRVYPAPDASKVKVFGPGLVDGFIGNPGQFTIDTREGGVGTLLVRVHGMKDSFKIEADPIDLAEPRVLVAKYTPTMPGNYTIFVRWSGVHVTGSPFSVKISMGSYVKVDKVDESSFTVKPVRSKQYISNEGEISCTSDKAASTKRKKFARSKSGSSIPSTSMHHQLKMKRNPSLLDMPPFYRSTNITGKG